MKVEKWLHITELGGDTWVLPILGALNDAVDLGKIKPMEEDFYELTMSVSIKLNMIPRIIARINRGRFNLFKEIEAKVKPEYTFTKVKVGRSIPVDNNLKYELLCDIDLFFFEVNSCCELMTEFIFKLLNHCGKKIDKKDVINYIKNVIEEKGGNTEWFIDLDKSRNFFTHIRAPYIAVDLTNDKHYKILTMKKIKQTFENEENYIPINIFEEIAKGFKEAKVIIQKYLINYLKNL